MSNILFIVMYGIAETSLGLCGATTTVYLLIFCVDLVVNRTLQEFKNDLKSLRYSYQLYRLPADG